MRILTESGFVSRMLAACLLGSVSSVAAAAASTSPATQAAAAPGATPLRSARDLARQLPCRGEFFEVEGRPAFLLLPAKDANLPSIPWVWYAPTFAVHPDASHTWMFRRFLEHGIAIAGVDVGESYGNPRGRAIYSAFFETLRRNYRLAERACLLPQSRGGLMLYNWAAENPQRVACIAGIYTVCDLRSYPGLATACGAYGMDAATLATHLAEHNPIERLRPLAEAGVPILHVHGDHDKLVPLEKNSGELAARYRALGGQLRLIVVPGKGHQIAPEFFESQELLDFVITHAHGTTTAPAGPASQPGSRAKRETVACEPDLVAAKHLIPSLEHLPSDARKFLKMEFTRSTQGSVYLDLYLPAKPSGLLPLIVWIHGGGWHTSSTARNDYIPARMVSRGYALASIDYRDSKAAKFPAQIQDCKAAVRWLRAHAAEYGIDPQRVGAWGISAGGHLAALLGTSGGEKELEGDGGMAEFSSRVQAACDFCGPTDFFQMDALETVNVKALLRTMTEEFVGGKLEEHLDLVAKANPITYSDSSDPPFLIMHGDADPLIALKQSELLYDALKAKGVEVSLCVARGGSHLFVGPEVNRAVDAFFDAHLSNRPAAAANP